MDSLAAQGAAVFGTTLAELVAKKTVEAAAAKVKTLKSEKDADKIRAVYDDLINQLMDERSEALDRSGV